MGFFYPMRRDFQISQKIFVGSVLTIERLPKNRFLSFALNMDTDHWKVTPIKIMAMRNT